MMTLKQYTVKSQVCTEHFGEDTSCVCQLNNLFMGQSKQPYICWITSAGLKRQFEDGVEAFELCNVTQEACGTIHCSQNLTLLVFF